MDAIERFRVELPLIEDVIAFTCRRHHLYEDEAQDFRSWALVRLMERDYAILRKFENRASLRTYLTTVIQRLFLDYRIKKWGKWRPCARAKELSEDAVALDCLLNRDGYLPHEAIQTLLVGGRTEATEEQLWATVAQLPNRPRRRFESDKALERLYRSKDRADRILVDEERVAQRRQLADAVVRALDRLSSEDYLIARLRFHDGLAPHQIATALRLDPRKLYRRIDRIKRDLRRILRSEGIEGPTRSDDSSQTIRISTS